MYGSGLHLLETCGLRVQEIDFARREITVRNGKGEKDRVTMLPRKLIEPIKRPPPQGATLAHRCFEEGCRFRRTAICAETQIPKCRDPPGLAVDLSGDEDIHGPRDERAPPSFSPPDSDPTRRETRRSRRENCQARDLSLRYATASRLTYSRKATTSERSRNSSATKTSARR